MACRNGICSKSRNHRCHMRPGLQYRTRLLVVLAMLVCAWLWLASISIFTRGPHHSRLLPVPVELFSIINHGTLPWVVAMLVLQAVASYSPRFRSWCLSRKNSDVLLHIVAAVTVCVVSTLAIRSYGIRIASKIHYQWNISPFAPFMLWELLGLLALVGLMVVSYRWSIGGAVAMFALSETVTGMWLAFSWQNARFYVLGAIRGQEPMLLYSVIAMLVVAILSLQMIRVPQLPDRDKGPEIRIPILAAGVLPVTVAWLMEEILRKAIVLGNVILSYSAIPHLHGILNNLTSWTSFWFWTKTVLLMPSVPIALQILYPTGRLQREFQSDADRIRSCLFSARSPLLLVNLLLFGSLSILAHSASDRLRIVGISNSWALYNIPVCLAFVFLTVRAHWRISSSDTPICTYQTLDLFSAYRCQDLLSSAGIQSALVSLSVPQLYPFTLPFAGETKILVDARFEHEAAEILAEHMVQHGELTHPILDNHESNHHERP